MQYVVRLCRSGQSPTAVPCGIEPWILRPTNEDDWDDWRVLRLEALAESPEAFSSTLSGWTGPGDTEQRWRARLRDVPYNVLVLRHGRPVGMVSATACSEGVELISMWVHPNTRGLGAGDALVGGVLTWASDRGATLVHLAVRAANRHAVELYERNGFEVVGPVGNPGDELAEQRMERRLT